MTSAHSRTSFHRLMPAMFLVAGVVGIVSASPRHDLQVARIAAGQAPAEFQARADGLPRVAGPVKVEAQELPLVINLGLSGSWYDPASPGRGFFIDILPRRKEIVVVWVTFDGEAPRWYSALGPFEGASAALNIYETQVRGSITESVAVGSARLDFKSCTSAKLTHDLEIGEPKEIPLARLTPDVQCQALRLQPNIASLFALEGIAYATDETGKSADCKIQLLYELKRELSKQGRITYKVTGGGHVSRGAVDENGDGIGIFADVIIPGGAVVWTPPYELRISGPGSDEDRHGFFRELAHFEGISASSGRAVGSWTCERLEFDEETGYVDVGPIAEGTWYMSPLPQQPVED